MKNNINKKQLREFGILIAFAFPILLGIIIPSLFGHNFKVWTLWIGVPALVLSIFNPKLLFYPYKAWIAFGNILGFINSKIILSLVFLLVLQPIAFIMKVFKYDPLRQKKSNKYSYREMRRNSKIDITRIF